MYGQKGVDLIEGYLYRVPETLPIQVLEQMKVPEKDGGIKVMSNAEKLVEADGILFGFPTRYGSMVARTNEVVFQFYWAIVEGTETCWEA
ncbi:hypothetical protein IFM89_023558 [Coptis chinensis]|uniref:NAD(P)H dehydrogenase (quinone) n=1 Tax=Coptis chinensis TaxID=261450 RepID=A0A835IF48_9MAGN|nr:hypothetical protein IFM89_023558 [Coptis chinensis]